MTPLLRLTLICLLVTSCGKDGTLPSSPYNLGEDQINCLYLGQEEYNENIAVFLCSNGKVMRTQDFKK